MYHRCFGAPRRYGYAFAFSSPSEPFYRMNRHERGSGRRRHSSFGVRRPLRYLSYQLDLSESQTRQLARILDRLKTEQAQAALDDERAASAVADLVTKPDLSVDDVREALVGRVEAAERMRTEVAQAVQELSAMLDPDQREELAYLLSSKAFSL